MKPWIESKTIRFLAATWLAGVLMQLVPMLQAHAIDWWALGAQSVATLAAVIIRMGQADIEAPISALNRTPKP